MFLGSKLGENKTVKVFAMQVPSNVTTEIWKRGCKYVKNHALKRELKSTTALSAPTYSTHLPCSEHPPINLITFGCGSLLTFFKSSISASRSEKSDSLALSGNHRNVLIKIVLIGFRV